jgi:uncharacterized protein (TIGR02466 family)
MSHETLQATVHPLWAVPLIESEMPDAQALNEALRHRFLKMEAEGDVHRDAVRRDTQYGLFESNFHLHTRPEPEIRALCRFIDLNLRQFVAGMSGMDEAGATRLQLQYHTWFHVTRTGGYQGLHNHPNAAWSGIYCVDPGDPGEPGSNSGAVRFHDPRAGCDMYLDPSNNALQVPYRHGPWQLQHKPGKLLMFPSYLLHEIFPYTGERPRIVVAFNAWHARQ